MDMFNILVLIGCGMAAWQRRFWKPARMTFNTDAWLILFFIAFLMLSDIMLNSFELATAEHVSNTDKLSFVAYPLSLVWTNIGHVGERAGGVREHLVVRAPVRTSCCS